MIRKLPVFLVPVVIPAKAGIYLNRFRIKCGMTVTLILWVLLLQTPFAQATSFEPNNKVGIHISAPSDDDIAKACELVNANGGAWGYVTVVMQANDLNKDKWQGMFDKFRECKIIPIVRIATSPDGDVWRKPNAHDTIVFTSFLDSLNWPVKDRFVVLFNEPNHGAEWGGECDGADFANTTSLFARRLKEKNQDFFVILGALDQVAPQSPPSHCAEPIFLQDMLRAQPNLFDEIRGFASHSYPNPAFIGPVYDNGRGSIRGYQWELSLLRSLGVTKDLPIFITETGWDQSKIGAERVADNFKRAFEDVWNDPQIQAVTPFDLHIGPPFCHFSWLHCDSGQFNGNFSTVSALQKKVGDPPQRHKMQIITTLPRELIEGSEYEFLIWLKNEGQSICDKRDGFELKIINATFDYKFSDCYNIKPGSSWVSNFKFKPGAALGNQNVRVGLFKNDKLVLPLFEWDIEILSKPDASIHVPLSPSAENFEFQLFDENQKIVFKRHNIRVIEGEADIAGIDNIALDECYRAVLLRRGYLPVQKECVTFTKTKTPIEFPLMLPVDRNGDGKFSFADLF